jgi:hypothetical protein
VTDATADIERPLDRLRVLAKQDVLVTPTLRHIEGFTLEGLLTFLWHGDPGAEQVVLMCGGAMGGLLGPANGLYHDLGETFAGDGIGVVRVGYRRPNDLPACVLDVAGAADLAHRNGARRFVIMGHSFGGAGSVSGLHAADDLSVVTLSPVGGLRARRSAAPAAPARRSRRAAAVDGRSGGAGAGRRRRRRSPGPAIYRRGRRAPARGSGVVWRLHRPRRRRGTVQAGRWLNRPVSFGVGPCASSATRAATWRRPSCCTAEGERHAWGRTAAALGTGTIDCDRSHGHGNSGWDGRGFWVRRSHATVRGRAQLVASRSWELTQRPRRLVTWAGADCQRPRRAVDIAPRVDPVGVERSVQFMTGHPVGFATLEEAADAVAAYVPQRPRPRDLNGLRKNLRQGTDGRFRWHWDPRFMNGDRPPRASQNPERLEAAARALRVPTLLVRGRLSDVVNEDGARAFVAIVPHARYVDVSGAGHMVAGDQNDPFTQAVVSFLAETDGRG